VIDKRFAHRSQSMLPEFVQVAARDAKRGDYLRRTLASEHGQHRPQPLFLF
jgi:hypothetical protein